MIRQTAGLVQAGDRVVREAAGEWALRSCRLPELERVVEPDGPEEACAGKLALASAGPAREHVIGAGIHELAGSAETITCIHLIRQSIHGQGYSMEP